MLKNTWVGLTLGTSGMAVGTDMIQIDGTGQVAFDMTSTGYKAPSLDTKNGLTGNVSFTPISGTNILEVKIKRALDTGDTQDYVLETDKDITFGWALRTTSPATLTSKHDRAGKFIMRMNTPKTPTPEIDPPIITPPAPNGGTKITKNAEHLATATALVITALNMLIF